MKSIPEIKPKWTCPVCGRQFTRQGQIHSCRAYSLEKHFENKPAGRALYEKLAKAVSSLIEPFKVESLQCCIHFVSDFTFAAVYVLKNKIRIDFSLSREITSNRFYKHTHLSAHRYLYYIDIEREEEIDEELLQWIQEAAHKEGNMPAHLQLTGQQP